jgi:hypothetical protein
MLSAAKHRKDVSISMISRLLGPFSDILCLFSSDLDGIMGVSQFLEGWMLTASDSSTLSRACRPKLVIVTEALGLPAHWDLIATQLFLDLVTSRFPNASLSSFFTSIQVLSVPPKYQQIMRFLQPLLHETKKTRKEERCLFSVIHFNAFFNYACDHWAQSPTTPFDFIQTTRLANPVSPGFPEHIDRFFSLLKPVQSGTALQLVASSLVLDSVPPGMHGMWWL